MNLSSDLPNTGFSAVVEYIAAKALVSGSIPWARTFTIFAFWTFFDQKLKEALLKSSRVFS